MPRLPSILSATNDGVVVSSLKCGILVQQRPREITIIIIIMFVYYSCSHNATTEPTSVTQDSTDTIERKASI